MRLIVVAALILVCFGPLKIDGADPIRDQYLEPNSLHCLSTSMNFKLSDDPDTSDIERETRLAIWLYTGKTNERVDFSWNKGNTYVEINYEQYHVAATTIYGENKLPLLYQIDQPFLAVPDPRYNDVPYKRNYTFTVSCTFPAVYRKNTTGDTVDNGGGHGGEDIMDPAEFVKFEVEGLKGARSARIGDELTFALALKDTAVYSRLLPSECRYFDPSDDQSLEFVKKGCPAPVPDVDGSYFGTISRQGETSYELKFKAFSFKNKARSQLGIECVVTLCIDENKDNCEKPDCWPYERVQAGTAEPIQGGTGEPVQGGTGEPVQGGTGEPIQGGTGEPIQGGTGEPIQGGTGEPPVQGGDGRPRKARSVLMRFNLADGNRLRADPPDTMTQKTVFDVESEPVCDNTSLFNTLYGVIGGLVVFSVVLLLTLVFVIYTSRQRKNVVTYPAVFSTAGPSGAI